MTYILFYNIAKAEAIKDWDEYYEGIHLSNGEDDGGWTNA